MKQTLDDIVFLRRNREYGAYRLRQEYGRHLVAGVGLVLFVLGVLLAGYYLPKFRGHTEVTFTREEVIAMTKAGGQQQQVKVEVFLPPPPPAKVEDVVPELVKDSIPPRKKPRTQPQQQQTAQGDTATGTGEGDGTGEGEGDGSGGGAAEGPGGTIPVHIAYFQYAGKTKEAAWYKWVEDHFNYPMADKITSRQGDIEVNFTLTSDGQLKDIQVVRGLSPTLDNEAVRIVRASAGDGRWVPARNRGNKPVASNFTVLVRVSLYRKSSSSSFPAHNGIKSSSPYGG